MSDHFRFLDLPLEIREIVYRELLCTWEMKHKRERAYLQTRYDNPTAILRTNKQVYHEAYDQLVKQNRFIRLDCEGISIRFHPLGRQVLPVTEDPKKIDHFKGYVAHVNWTAHSGHAHEGFRKRYMILGEQFPAILKCTEYHSITNWPILTMHISMHPIPTQWPPHPTPSPPPLRPFQYNLLHMIPTLLHAFPRLTISGAVDPRTASAILHETSLPRWTDPIAALSDLLWFKHATTRLHPSASALATSTTTECALQTIDYMRRSAAWPALVRAGGPAFVDAVAELAFGFLLSRADRALEGMLRSQHRRGLVETFAEQVAADLRECLAPAAQSSSSSTSGFDFDVNTANPWSPSNGQIALVLCMDAKRTRLLMDAANRDFAVRAVDRAARMWPGSEVVAGEREAVRVWSGFVDRYFCEIGGEADEGRVAMWEWWERGERFCDC